MIKKLVFVVLVLLLIISLVGCVKNKTAVKTEADSVRPVSQKSASTPGKNADDNSGQQTSPAEAYR